MVWDGISIGGRMNFYIIRNGTLTSRRHADEIAGPPVIPYAAAKRDSFVFWYDDTRPRSSRM